MNPLENEYNVQSALQREQMESEQGMNAPSMVQQQQQVQAALVAQTNPNILLEEVELKLKGFRQKYDGTFEKVSEPLMNNKGINRMIFLLSTVVNQNTILSHLEREEIGKLIIRASDDIVDDLVLNWRSYAIKDKMLLDHIVDAILFPSFMALKRAWKQNEKNWLNRAVVETINSSPRASPVKREGMFSKFKL